MKNGKPMMIIAIGVGKKGRGKDMEDRMEDDSEEMMGGGLTYAEGGSTGRGSRDGCAIKGKTKGRMV